MYAGRSMQGREIYLHGVLVEELCEGLAVGRPHLAGLHSCVHMRQGILQLNHQHHQARLLLNIELRV